MQQKFLIILSFILFATTFMVGKYFNTIADKDVINETEVYVFPLDKTFIIPKDIEKTLPKKKNISIDDIEKLEQKLEENDYIAQAEIYKNLNGKLIAEVTQYKPIARVIKGNKSYYIDIKGLKKPLSKYYTENVVLIYGDVNKTNNKEILSIIKTIYKDKILNQIISEIHIKNDKIYLKTNDLSAKITLDKSRNIKNQLNKLKAIYAYLIKNKQVQKYQSIDLSYHNQAVCK
jgi:cell division protein FtsQ